ncbi:uncharacterized protein PV09_05005 [Verruconis gallopava]|uniref:Phosducin domain-containing protein n=1 Tax=Verruconis gallopava TaxID=253628 RepID=A0A0D1YSS3_9PEZI|nr:uncharacterized protein PV09_05005 [Verruconis gallopava]KIW03687.1 hypothetical protein PV09_05005 [Verruconis gallopava]
MASAQDEFNAIFNKSGYETGKVHPDDRDAATPSDTSRSPSPAQSFLNIDDDEDNAEDLAVKAMRGTYYVPRAARMANTGPKGVIADAQAFEQAKRQARSIRTMTRNQRSSYAPGGQSPPSVYKSEEFDKSSDDDDDETFLESWRQKRLLELANKNITHVLGSSGKKLYGDLRKVDAEGFLNIVEGSPANTVVLVLIYDHSSEVSSLVEEAVREMASMHATSRFIKLHYTEAEFEPAGVPALLAYRGGEKFAGFVPVSDEIPDHEELSARTLTALLQRHQVL